MFIEEIIIDGFKSYATRTVVSGFDHRFNAITGLNGSGKSNILDSICFVLGISNLSQVRASNLQDLVYKQGQAGVTRAMVSIVFNNQDHRQSPVGYEQYERITISRTVVLGGRNKYMINGHTAQVSQVKNLFHSVQLNVDNPHFLIMQGRITKVLNMKPIEILGMIEEAAGTRMFESKKQSALKTIEKKQAKVDEINKILAEEITPKLEKLRTERSHYLKWTANNGELERLERLCIAADFVAAENTARTNAQELAELGNEVRRLEGEAADAAARAAEKERDAAALSAKKESEMEGEYRLAVEAEAAASKALVKADSVWKNRSASLHSEQAAQRQLAQQASEAAAALAAVQERLADHRRNLDILRSKAVDASAALLEAQRAAQALSTGYAGGNASEGGSLAERGAEASRRGTQARAAAEQASMRVRHLKGALKEKAAAIKLAKKDLSSIESESTRLECELAALRAEQRALQFDENLAIELRRRVDTERIDVISARERYEALNDRLSARLQFQYSDPLKGFDRARVKGLVAKLVTVLEPGAATALEVVAGGKLYQVVVDTADTGKLLLEKGRLRGRVTILPLNSISNATVSAETLRIAQEVGGGVDKVRTALSLLDCPVEVRRAVEHVFGGSLVCADLPTAQAVTFHKTVRTRAVTMDGDVCDPSGTLQGGSRGASEPVLLSLAEATAASRALGSLEQRLAVSEAEVERSRSVAERYASLASKIQLKEHELSLVRERLAESRYAALVAEAAANERALEEATAAAAHAEAEAESAETEAQTLATEARELAAGREKAMKILEKKITAAKADAGRANVAVKTAEECAAELEMEVDKMKEDIGSSTAETGAIEERVESFRLEVSALAVQVAERKKEYELTRASLETQRRALERCDAAMRTLQSERALSLKAAEAATLAAKKLGHTLSRCTKEQASAVKSVDSMLRQHAWIEGERVFFGKPGTDYDFDGMGLGVEAARLRRNSLMVEQETLGRCINKKVMGMMEKAEGEYKELMSKRRIIENDKRKIEKAIEEVQEKKDAALVRTWEKVNGDFGSIFSSLLPGTQAKLQPPDDGTVLDGLEVRVAFGEVWKESLTELSGGQRYVAGRGSLLALSLILALLLFKPAPMYILDEVDAALDLSHTQNIGQMLRAHFKQSQFIVVSLKEGMFNNANVIFRTKFVDGVSTVQRTRTMQSDLVPYTAIASRKTMVLTNNTGGSCNADENDSAEGNKRPKKTKAART